MTKQEHIEMIHSIKAYLTAGNPIWDTCKIAEACDAAISALESIGCEGCIYEDDTPWKMSNPCGVCKRKRTDYWRKDYVES